MRHTFFRFSLFLILFSLSAPIFAQGATTAQSHSYDMLDILQKGGVVMYVLLALSFCAFCLIFYYLLSLRTSVIAPREFIIKAEHAIHQKDFEMLAKLCDIFLRSKNNYQMIKSAIEDEGNRQAGLLWHRIQALQDIAVIAPMVGLLGTVIGMIKSFMGLNAEVATPRPTVIASGVSMALTTTAAGLIIGIFAMIVYSLFRAKINKILTVLENSCNKIAVDMMVVDNDIDSPF